LALSPVTSTIYQGGKETINVQITTLANQTETYVVTVSDPTPTSEMINICSAQLGNVGTNVKCGVNKFNVTFLSSVSGWLRSTSQLL
jgi:hypothetical protein